MAQRIKTFLITPGEGKQYVGKHPERDSGQRIYVNGVGYEIQVASKFETGSGREQELTVKRV